MNSFIDLRSDTVTQPSKEMKKAMLEAPLGDDVYGEDPTVNKLQKMFAELTGKEASLFVPTGVMGNQICLNVHTTPGSEIICEKDAHIFHFENGSTAALSGVQLSTVKGEKGIISDKQIEELVRPSEAYYMPQTKVIEIENTHNMSGGRIYSIKKIKEIKRVAKKYKVIMHLDGARLWNASVKSGVSLEEYAKHFDSLSCCLSKGLGTPLGSIIAGNKGFIKEAHRIRKSWGGGMRQIGIIAAAGIFAIENNFKRLEEDHFHAEILAEKISKIENLYIEKDAVETNIVVFKPIKLNVKEAITKCKEKGLLVSSAVGGNLRMVTHLGISMKDIMKACNILRDVFS